MSPSQFPIPSHYRLLLVQNQNQNLKWFHLLRNQSLCLNQNQCLSSLVNLNLL
jgi:hypothetical protein